MIITSTQNKQIKDLLKLHNKKERDFYEMFLVEGEHLVECSIESGSLISLVVLDSYETKYDYPKITVSSNVMKKLSKQVTIPNVIGICKKNSECYIKGNVLLLDDIQDPGNLGTIIRSCLAFDIQTIILSPNSVDVYNDKVIRSSEGSIFKLNYIVEDLKSMINELKKDDYNILASVVTGGVKPVKMTSKYALIMGNEGKGINKELTLLADQLITIKMNEQVESLNVGVATGILLYEFNKE